jgi:hypothetical protein
MRTWWRGFSRTSSRWIGVADDSRRSRWNVP